MGSQLNTFLFEIYKQPIILSTTRFIVRLLKLILDNMLMTLSFI